jgi:nucleoside-diphosphate-sugar epimerase
MNILITGGTGFIGSRLALQCVENKTTVRVLGQENNSAEEENNRILRSKGVEVVLASVTERDNVFETLKGIDVVYHLAAAQHEANIPDQVFRDVNVTGTQNVLEGCIQAGVRRLVHGSTIGVYGSGMDGEISENSTVNPDNIYGRTKLEGEKLVLSYKDKLPSVIIRISETYGPGDRRLLKLFKTIQKNFFFVIGNGRNKHHLLYVDDLINSFFLAAESEEALGEVFVVAGKEVVTTDEMCTVIANTVGATPPRLHAPFLPFLITAVLMEKTLRPMGIQPPLHRRRMDFFKKNLYFTQEKTNQKLGYKPKYSFAEGAQNTADWYRENRLL